MLICPPRACLVLLLKVKGEALDVELQMVVTTMWVLRIEPRTSGRAVRALNHRTITPAPVMYDLRMGSELFLI